MYWILAALFLLVTLAVPRLRPFAVVGCAILGALLAWAVIQRVRGPGGADLQERGHPTTPAADLRAIPLDEVELADMKLSGGGAPFKLTGSVANRSSTLLLKSMMLDISRHDCHRDALDPSGCVPNWRVRQWIELAVPPHQERRFSVSIWARGDAPQMAGTARDEFEVVAANGELMHAQ